MKSSNVPFISNTPDDTHIQFHDPGLPAIPNREVTIEQFEAAWSDQERELDAIRLSA